MLRGSSVRIWFVRREEPIWDVRWPVVPRIGEAVRLPPGQARVVDVIWELGQGGAEAIVKVEPEETD